MRKMFSKILILIFCIILLNGCSCNKNKDLIVYRNYYEQDVSTFNYLITNNYHDVIRIANLVDGLVENDKYGNIVPSIAKSWSSQIVDGKQVWTFHLKDDVYWSDYNGDKYAVVTAHDFVTALKYSLNYNTRSNNYSLAGNLIENAMNYYNATLMKNFNYEDIVTTINKLEINDPNHELEYYKNIKSVFDSCQASNLCVADFDSVGIKAINDFELQFTLANPVPYFLSALTYYAFLPANENFIKEIGFNNFGTSRKTLLYNGAYLLSNYSHSSRIEYTKNNNYWDKDNVFIDKLIFTKALNYHSISYTRLAYENGNIDEFTVNKLDEYGWSKYVKGSSGLGNETSPMGINAYLSTEVTNFTTYYLLFNQNRMKHKYTTLTQEETYIANSAMSNINFRKALTYGLDRSTYFNNDLNVLNSSIVPSGFTYNGTKDYNDYYLETYASKNEISYSETKELFKNDPYFDLDKSQNYLDIALQELNISNENLPIKIEYTYYYNEDYVIYDKNRIEKWNRDLNGCKENTTTCEYDKIMIVYNEMVDSLNDYNVAFDNKEYHITFLGLYPDFNDPTTFLNSFSSNGELLPYLNHTNGNEIDVMLNNINNHYEESTLDERFRLCGELEYYIILEENLLLPLALKGPINQIIVSNLVPYSKMNASYGLSPYKFKHRKISTQDYTQDDILRLKEEYDRGRPLQ